MCPEPPSLPDPSDVQQYRLAMEAINAFELDSLQPPRPVGRRRNLIGQVAKALGLKPRTTEIHRLHIKQTQIAWLALYAQVRKPNGKKEGS